LAKIVAPSWTQAPAPVAAASSGPTPKIGRNCSRQNSSVTSEPAARLSSTRIELASSVTITRPTTVTPWPRLRRRDRPMATKGDRSTIADSGSARPKRASAQSAGAMPITSIGNVISSDSVRAVPAETPSGGSTSCGR
jgi:hypothetical protein